MILTFRRRQASFDQELMRSLLRHAEISGDVRLSPDAVVHAILASTITSLRRKWTASGSGSGSRCSSSRPTPSAASFDHELGEFASVLRFVENNWGLTQLTDRDRDAIGSPTTSTSTQRLPARILSLSAMTASHESSLSGHLVPFVSVAIGPRQDPDEKNESGQTRSCRWRRRTCQRRSKPFARRYFDVTTESSDSER